MAFVPAEELARRHPNGIRRLGYLEAGVRDQSEPMAGNHRVRIDGAIGTIRHHGNHLRAWVILGITGPTGGAAFGVIAARGHL